MVALCEYGEGFPTGFQCFERRQRGVDFFDQRGPGVEFVIADRFARVAWVAVITRHAKGFERVCQGFCSGARTRPTQQRSFKGGHRLIMRALPLPEPQQWVF